MFSMEKQNLLNDTNWHNNLFLWETTAAAVRDCHSYYKITTVKLG
jgi:hypothetical protein